MPAAAAAAADDALGAGEGRVKGEGGGLRQGPNLGQKGFNCAHDSQILLQCYIRVLSQTGKV